MFIKEPDNSVNKEKDEKEDDNLHDYCCKLLNEYAIGFKKIFTNKAATFIMFGALLKSWDTAINQSFLSDFMKSYTNDINDPSEVLNKQLYPSLVSGAELVGGFTANLSSAALIDLFAVDDPLAIPKVIVIKELICLPSMYMMYLIPDQFWWSIGGYYLKQSLGQGWKTPAILMLKSVVDPEIVSLLIGIFLFLIINLSTVAFLSTTR